MKSPNILLILTDQQRLSACSPYGDTVCQTPALDRLAQEGILFRNAYTSCPLCSPARATIHTGLFPHSHGVTSNVQQLGCSIHQLTDTPDRLPRRLQQAGYSTGWAGKWHLGDQHTEVFHTPSTPSLPSDMGYEGIDTPGHGGDGAGYPAYRQWLKQKHGISDYQLKEWTEETEPLRKGIGELDLPFEATVPAWLVEQTMERIDQFETEDRPWFMNLNFWGPHGPYHATKEYLALYRDHPIPPWTNFHWPARNQAGAHHYKIHWDEQITDWSPWETTVRYYYARMTMIDAQIGRLIDWLEESGRLDNTVIIFSSDHGDAIGSHGGLWDKGFHHFEETQRIPMILRLPEKQHAGTVHEELTSLTDIYPTILDAANAPAPSYKPHGQSLLSLIQNPQQEWRDSVGCEFLGLGSVPMNLRTIRWKNYKYGYNMSWPEELYDLQADPGETNNLAENPSFESTLIACRKRLEQWMVETSDPSLRMFRWHQGFNGEL